ncbi:hypothetical protein B0H13DRAFT_1895507 [Mycena leptocephala]|nr:hypothetical protein B0H13DRAFT_1895507 [Mycena leptocephala]
MTKPYEFFLEKIRDQSPKLEASQAPQLVELLKELGSVSDEIYLDYVGRFDLWADDTGSHDPHPILDDFYSTYTTSFLNRVVVASRAWNRYIACCSRAFDPTTKIRLTTRRHSPNFFSHYCNVLSLVAS